MEQRIAFGTFLLHLRGAPGPIHGIRSMDYQTLLVLTDEWIM